MVLKWTRTKSEPLKYFEQELNLNPKRYLKRFDTLWSSGKDISKKECLQMCLRLVRIGYQCLVIIFFDLIITTDAHLIVLIILTVKSRENFIRWKGVAKIFIRSKGVASQRRSQDFWLGGSKPQTACNDVIRNLQKRNFLWGKDIVEWKIWSCSP